MMTHKLREMSSCLPLTSGRTWRRRRRSAVRVNMVGGGGGCEVWAGCGECEVWRWDMGGVWRWGVRCGGGVWVCE